MPDCDVCPFSKMYWTDNSTGSDSGGVWMANMDGTHVKQLFPSKTPGNWVNKPTGNWSHDLLTGAQSHDFNKQVLSMSVT